MFTVLGISFNNLKYKGWDKKNGRNVKMIENTNNIILAEHPQNKNEVE